MRRTRTSPRSRHSFGTGLDLVVEILLVLTLCQVALAEDAGVPDPDAGAVMQAVQQAAPRVMQVQQQVVDLSAEVASIRLKLIEERFQALQQMAEANLWDKGAPPPPFGTLLCPSSEEWVFLKENLPLIRRGERPLPAPGVLAPAWME
jgi:hypothetical protein